MRFWLWRRARVYQNLQLSSLRLASWHRFLASSSATIRFVVRTYDANRCIQGTTSHPRSQRRRPANYFSLLRSSFERTSSPWMTFTPICPQRMMNWMTRGTKRTWPPLTRVSTTPKSLSLLWLHHWSPRRNRVPPLALRPRPHPQKQRSLCLLTQHPDLKIHQTKKSACLSRFSRWAPSDPLSRFSPSSLGWLTPTLRSRTCSFA